MKIGIAQIRPIKGDISKNIELHLTLIRHALSRNINALFFPELSLTAYEPELAEELKIAIDDSRLAIFQQLSNIEKISIGIGAPTIFDDQVQISTLLFQPNQSIQKYSKQILHEDELSYFVKGDNQLLIRSNEVTIALAICYESLQESHIDSAIAQGANIYIACVAKAQKGIDTANQYFPRIAREKTIPILLANSVGYCDNFESVGQSAVWNRKGQILGQLSQEEGILIYDTKQESVLKIVCTQKII